VKPASIAREQALAVGVPIVTLNGRCGRVISITLRLFTFVFSTAVCDHS
jgi:hypothetical protein